MTAKMFKRPCNLANPSKCLCHTDQKTTEEFNSEAAILKRYKRDTNEILVHGKNKLLGKFTSHCILQLESPKLDCRGWEGIRL